MSGKSLRVAIVSTQVAWHGGEKQAALLALGLRARGHDCSIVGREDGEFASRMRGHGFDVRTLRKIGRTVGELRQLRRIMKDLRPDVLHANDAHAMTATGMAGVGLAIPLRVAARRVDFPVRWPIRYRWCSHGLIGVSNAVASVCLAAGLPPSFVNVVHDGVDPSFADSGKRARGRASLRLADDERLLLTVAKLTDHKGHRYLLEAMPHLVEANPKLVLAFAGDGELRESLESKVASIGVSNHVRFLGYRDDIPDLLAAADVVVQPSHMEGLCSSLIDAMFASRPIVACRAGGIPDLFATQGDPLGWLTQTKSPSALSAAIDSALADPIEAIQRGRRAREHALLHFTVDHMVDATLAAYRELGQNVGFRHAALESLAPASSIPFRGRAA